MLNENYSLIMPGDLGFGSRNDVFTTLLGSCIAVTIWHPLLKVGGICHFVLPSNGQNHTAPMNPRYGDEAIRMMRDKVRSTRTNPQDYVTGVYGGSIMVRSVSNECGDNSLTESKKCVGCANVACRNKKAAFDQLSKQGFKVDRSDVGGRCYRQIRFRLSDGLVLLTRGVMPSFEPMDAPLKHLG